MQAYLKLALFAVLATVSFVFAQSVQAEEKAAKEVTIKGVVEVDVDEDDKVVAVYVSTDNDTVYSVTMDKNGAALGTKEGKTVEVKGTVVKKASEDGEVLWLTVTSAKEVKEEAEAEAEEGEM